MTATEPLTHTVVSRRLYAGLDLAKLSDFTAWVVVEQLTYGYPKGPLVKVVPPETLVDKGKLKEWLDPPKPEPPPLKQYNIRRIERFPKGTPYVDVCNRMVEVYSADALRGSTLAVDQTGVGEAVMEMLNKSFREARAHGARCQAVVRPILITAGASVLAAGAGWHVAKTELVGVLHALFGNDQLKLNPGKVPQSNLVKKELESFREKITPAGNVQFGAWREQEHDDLVLALAMACWVAERGAKQIWVR